MVVRQEFRNLAQRFPAQFGAGQPAWFIRAPGRINLIGEHTDYNGFPVMPMGIERAVRMAVAPRDDGLVVLKNADPSLYGDRDFEVAASIPPYPTGDWGNYVKAAVQSLVGCALDGGWTGDELKGMSCLVEGDVPPAAGLSSSTALVVAAGLAFSAVNGLGVGRLGHGGSHGGGRALRRHAGRRHGSGRLPARAPGGAAED